MSILIFTDGSSRGNPGPGGWGAIVHAGERVVELGGNEAKTTNNRMEMSAVIAALEWVLTNKDLTYVGGPKTAGAITINVKSDSKYVIHGITMWVSGWKRNGWKTAGKKDVGNRDLWEKMSALTHSLSTNGFGIKWDHVDGHIGIAGNERCDEIATSFADAVGGSGSASGVPIHLYDGPFMAYTIDLHFKEMTADQIAAKKAKKIAAGSKSGSKSGAKAYSYLSLVDDVLEKHKTWAECEARVKGVRGAKFKKSTSASNEQEIIKEWGL